MTMGRVLRSLIFSSAQLFCFGRLNFKKEQLPVEDTSPEYTIKAKCAHCGNNRMVLDEDTSVVLCARCGGAW